MINKNVYILLFIALLSFVSLNILETAGLSEITSENTIEYVEQNNIESEAKVFSCLSPDFNFDICEVKQHLGYKDRIYNIQIKIDLLRPPIFS